MSGIASTTSRDPRYLQTNLAMQDSFQEMKDRERMEAEREKQETLLRRLANPTSMDMIGTPATKQFEVNGRMVGQNAPAQMQQVMPDEMRLRSLTRAFPRESLVAELQKRFAPETVTATKPGEIGRRSDGTIAWENPAAPDAAGTFKVGSTREIKRGGKNVTEEFDGTSWKQIAEAPAWKPDEAPKADTFGDASKLRGEFDAKTKDFSVVRDAYSKMVEVAKEPSAAGDMSLIYGFMKLNDPGSTVREGEFATAQNSGGVDDRVRAAYNNVLRGERFNPNQRADFLKQAGAIYSSQEKQFKREFNRYSDLAKQFKADPKAVVYDRTEGLGKVSVGKTPDGKPVYEIDGKLYVDEE